MTDIEKAELRLQWLKDIVRAGQGSRTAMLDEAEKDVARLTVVDEKASALANAREWVGVYGAILSSVEWQYRMARNTENKARVETAQRDYDEAVAKRDALKECCDD